MAIQQSTFIRRVGLTYVVQIGFGSHSPETAQKVADEFISAYMDRQLNDKVQLVERANGDLDGSLSKLRREALDAEAQTQEYKNRFNLMSIEGATMAEAEVSNLNRQIAEARADRAEKDAPGHRGARPGQARRRRRGHERSADFRYDQGIAHARSGGERPAGAAVASRTTIRRSGAHRRS